MSFELTLFNNLSQEDYNYQIIPKLWAVDVCSFSRVSKATQAIVRGVAALPHEDRTFSGEKVSVNFNGSIPKFLKHKQKMDLLMDVFTRHPEFQAELMKAKTAGELEATTVAQVKANKKTNLWVSWDEFDGHQKMVIVMMSIVFPPFLPLAILRPVRELGNQVPLEHGFSDLDFVAKNAREVNPLIVLFDLDTQQLRAQTVHLLSLLDFQLYSPELLRIILTHPMFTNLPGSSFPFKCSCHLSEGGEVVQRDKSGPKGLGMILKIALNTYKNSDEDKLKCIKIIFSHRNAKDIRPEELQSILSYAVHGGLCDHGKWCGGNPEIVKAILSHPNAIQIPISGKDSLSSALEDAKKIGNGEMIQVLQSEIAKRRKAVETAVLTNFYDCKFN